jgi:hypothetical protein
MSSGSLGIVEAKKFLEALRKARHGEEVPAVTLTRTLGIELWLRNHKRWMPFGGEVSGQSVDPLPKEATTR